MKSIYFLIIITLCHISLYSQINNSDSSYDKVVNKNYTGNVSESGINNTQNINNQLQKSDRRIDSIANPKGWDELLTKADIQLEKEKNIQHKKDFVRFELENQSKLTLIKKQEEESFRNKMIGYLIGLIVIIILFATLKKTIRITKGKLNFNQFYDFKKLNQKEIVFISIGIGILISILLGLLFSETKYYRISKGNSVEVTKELSTFKLSEFNFFLAVFCFIVFTGICYFYLRNKSKNFVK